MKKYLIAGIKLGFSYKYDQYFKNNIESYEIKQNEKIEHSIQMIYQSDLTLPKEGFYRVFSKNVSGFLKSYMTYTENLKEVKIYIDPTAFSDLATAEYIYSGMVFLEIAQLNGLFPLHGSAILYKDEVILFSAPSGTGKSTHAKLWKEVYGKEVSWVNDDKPLLSVQPDGTVDVYGAPFSGAYHENSNKKRKLKTIVFLRQGVSNRVTQVNQKDALQRLIQNALRPSEEKLWEQMLKQIETIITNIPMYHLEASLSHNAVHAIHAAIYEGKYED